MLKTFVIMDNNIELFKLSTQLIYLEKLNSKELKKFLYEFRKIYMLSNNIKARCIPYEKNI